MKKFVLSLLRIFPMLLPVMVWSQQPVTITGALKKSRISAVKLFCVEEGRPKLVDRSTPDEKGQFSFQFHPAAGGLFAIGTGSELIPYDNYTIYCKPGDQLSLFIDDSAYHLTGSANSPENTVLEQWFIQSYPVMRKSIYYLRSPGTYEDFMLQFSTLQPGWEKWRKSIHTGNPVFDELARQYVEADEAFIALNYLTTPFRRNGPKPGDPAPAYFTRWDIGQLTATAALLQFPYGKHMLDVFLSYAVKYDPGAGQDSRGDQLAHQLQLVTNDTLQGALVLSWLEGASAYTRYMDLQEAYGRYLVTTVQQERASEKRQALEKLRPGSAGYNFSYPDPSGKEFSLAGLKGKVVLVDLWATWCGPCKAEIPYLQKLEEAMQGKEVAFVSISVDQEKDKEKWRKFVADNKLGGIQLYAKGLKDLTDFYQVSSIPRFLLFDRNGQLIDHNAPRPSGKELRKLIEQYL